MAALQLLRPGTCHPSVATLVFEPKTKGDQGIMIPLEKFR